MADFRGSLVPLLLVVTPVLADSVTCTVFYSYCSLGGGSVDESGDNLNAGARSKQFVVENSDFPLSNPRMEYSDPGGVNSACPSHCPLTVAASGIDCATHTSMDSHFTWDTATGTSSNIAIVDNAGTAQVSLYSHYTCAMPPGAPPPPPSVPPPPPTEEIVASLLERVASLEARLARSCLHASLDAEGFCQVTPGEGAAGIKFDGTGRAL